MASSGMLRRVALVRTDVSEALSASIIRMTRLGEIGITLAVTSNRRKLRRNIAIIHVVHRTETTNMQFRFYSTNEQTLWPLVRTRIIPTERPSLVDEI
jgi:hypothetical protein